MSNSNRKKHENNYEQRLHHTLSRYGKNKKIKKHRSIPSMNDVPKSQTNGIHDEENDGEFAISLNLDNFRTLKYDENVKYADDTTDTECTNDEPCRFQDIESALVVRSKEDYLFDNIDQQNEAAKKLKLSNNDHHDLFDRYFQTQIYRLKRERSGFIWRCLGLKFANNFWKNRAKGEMWPLFTYWLIAMELFIVIYLSTYGIVPCGKTETKVSKVIWHQTNSFQPATYYQHPNIWYGPSYSDLISAGVKFTPCMRRDMNIMKSIEMRNSLENEYGCCLRNDLSGCVQTAQSQCSNRTSFWIKWPNRSGPVCGNDPRYCMDKSMNISYEKNITDWPICNQYDNEAIYRSKDLHMKCKVQARPCCVGIYGKCILASKEYCEFIKGHHHPHASLCSQVNCMEDVCGDSLWPHQFYRLFLSLFIHAGWFQLLINLVIQYVFMRRLEQLLGIWRTVLIYFLSGIGGNMASAIFLPLTPEVGPNASLLGLISFLFIECYRQQNINGKVIIMLKIFVALFILFVPGFLLPFVDIYSLVFGFIYGFLITTIVHPDESKSMTSRIIATISFIVLTTILIVLFIFATDLLEQYRYYTNLLNCLPIIMDCSKIDIVYDEIKALN